jgi:hypothetical protein
MRQAFAQHATNSACGKYQFRNIIHLRGLIGDDDENVASHALVAASRLITNDNLASVFAVIGANDKQSAGITRAVVASACDPVALTVQAIQQAQGASRSWLVYLLATIGREKSQAYVKKHVPQLLKELDFFWKYHEQNWTNRLDVADQLDFLQAQYL